MDTKVQTEKIKNHLRDILSQGDLSIFFDYIDASIVKKSNFYKKISQVQQLFKINENDNLKGILDSKEYIINRNKYVNSINEYIESVFTIQETIEYDTLTRITEENKILKQENEILIQKINNIVESNNDETKVVEYSQLCPLLIRISKCYKRIKIMNYIDGMLESEYSDSSVDTFWIMANKITYDEYFNFIKSEKIEEIDIIKNLIKISESLSDNFPITLNRDELSIIEEQKQQPALVTYNGAIEYIKWLSDRTRNIYRLPFQKEISIAYLEGDISHTLLKHEIRNINSNLNTIKVSNKKSKEIKKNNTQHISLYENMKSNHIGINGFSDKDSEWCYDFYPIKKENENGTFISKLHLTFENSIDNFSIVERESYHNFRLIKEAFKFDQI
jgi:Sulfatase-modifying factor enzyme 1